MKKKSGLVLAFTLFVFGLGSLAWMWPVGLIAIAGSFGVLHFFEYKVLRTIGGMTAVVAGLGVFAAIVAGSWAWWANHQYELRQEAEEQAQHDCVIKYVTSHGYAP
jgi:hypothetical protein